MAPPLAASSGCAKFRAQEHRAQIGSHYGVPFLDGCFHQRLGNLHRGIVHQSIQEPWHRVHLLEDGLHVLRAGDVRLDENSVCRKAFAECGAVDAHDPPASLR